MLSLRYLCELCGVAEKDDVRCRAAARERIGEGKLPRFVDDEHVESIDGIVGSEEIVRT